MRDSIWLAQFRLALSHFSILNHSYLLASCYCILHFIHHPRSDFKKSTFTCFFDCSIIFIMATRTYRPLIEFSCPLRVFYRENKTRWWWLFPTSKTRKNWSQYYYPDRRIPCSDNCSQTANSQFEPLHHDHITYWWGCFGFPAR